MSSAPRSTRPPLFPGQRLKQAEFHRRYEAYPKDVKFELIGGVVHMPSPLRRTHGSYHLELNGIFWHYKRATPGVEALDNTTTILGEASEPQPDLDLRILEGYGGQSQVTEDDYVAGPPELMAEVAHSSRDIDLGQKRSDYEQAGVLEYLVLCVVEQQLRWFHFPSGRELKPNRQGIWKSQVFPGLWIDGRALLACDSNRLLEVVQQGLASPGHVRFVKRLQAAHRRRSQG